MTPLKKLEIYKPDQPPPARELALIYADSGDGKTRLATSLPDNDHWGKIGYFALDDGSETLESVLPNYRSRITVVKPDWSDPIVTAAEIAGTDWEKEIGIRTAVLDTFGNMSWKLLADVANKGVFSDKNITVGMGTILKTALPMMGDYGGVHALTRGFINTMFNKQKNLNLIFLCHTEVDKDDMAGTVGGPATVGRAMITWLPARFKTVIHLTRDVRNVMEGGKLVQKTTRVARCSPHGAWIARINEASPGGNPLESFPLPIDPSPFWDRHWEVTHPKKEAA